MSTTDAVTFWEGVYAARPAATDPQPNDRLAETVTGLPPGDVLDLGCGDGGDALWLARRGWHVTAVDISAVAVERLAGLARSRGLGDRVIAERHDLHESFPQGGFDLICAHYLHTPFDLDRATVLRAAAHALRLGGRLLVVDHGSTAPWSWNQDPDVRYPTPREVAAGIDLDPATWTVERADAPRRIATGPGGRTAEVTDHVLLIRRTAERANEVLDGCTDLGAPVPRSRPESSAPGMARGIAQHPAPARFSRGEHLRRLPGRHFAAMVFTYLAEELRTGDIAVAGRVVGRQALDQVDRLPYPAGYELRGRK
ncbi:class I SAM-dependent methyltransferase [Streptosporangium sp. NPDC002607]